MKKIEYKQIEYSDYPSAEELNEKGINGWDLIHIFPTKKKYYDAYSDCYTKEIYKATFKREFYRE